MDTHTSPVILSGCRTAIGSFGGALASVPAPRLGAVVIKESVRRAGVAPEHIDEVIMGNVLTAGVGQAPARQAALFAGIPDSVPCMTINKVCGSGLKSVMLAAQAIQCGDAELAVAGGMESMSNAPYLLDKARTGYRMGNGTLLDSMIKDGLWDVYNDYHMGSAAELCARECNISREAQDAYAIMSYTRAQAAAAEGRLKDEIVGVPIQGKKGETTIVDVDEDIAKTDFKEITHAQAVVRQVGLCHGCELFKDQRRCRCSGSRFGKQGCNIERAPGSAHHRASLRGEKTGVVHHRPGGRHQ